MLHSPGRAGTRASVSVIPSRNDSRAAKPAATRSWTWGAARRVPLSRRYSIALICSGLMATKPTTAEPIRPGLSPHRAAPDCQASPPTTFLVVRNRQSGLFLTAFMQMTSIISDTYLPTESEPWWYTGCIPFNRSRGASPGVQLTPNVEARNGADDETDPVGLAGGRGPGSDPPPQPHRDGAGGLPRRSRRGNSGHRGSDGLPRGFAGAASAPLQGRGLLPGPHQHGRPLAGAPAARQEGPRHGARALGAPADRPGRHHHAAARLGQDFDRRRPPAHAPDRK